MSALETEIQELNARSKRLNGEIAQADEALQEAIGKFQAEGKSYATASPEELAEIGELGKKKDGLRDEYGVVNGLLTSRMNEHGNSRQAETAGGMTAASRVLAHPAYAAHDWEGSGQVGALPSVEIANLEQTKARLRTGGNLFAAATDDLTNVIALDQRLYPPVEILRRKIRLIDLITVGATTSNTVVYAQQTTRTSAAAETAYGVAYGEAAWAFSQVTANVRDIGHWTTAYRSQIADAAQFQTIVENQLQEDLLQRLELQILKGDGAGVNLRGIMNFSGVQSVQRDTTNENRMDAVHRGLTLVRLAFREPNAILFHPNDYQETVFTKAVDSGMYLYPADVRGEGPSLLWGLQVVVSPVATEGTAIVGYWPDATLWMRSGVALSISDSHSDYFIKRQVAVLAELRAAFSVTRPAAFCEVLMV